MLLKDKVVVISGVGPGLGRTLALEAATDGAKLVLGARNQEFLASVVAEVEAAGGAAVARGTDVTLKDQCQALVTLGVDT